MKPKICRSGYDDSFKNIKAVPEISLVAALLSEATACQSPAKNSTQTGSKK